MKGDATSIAGDIHVDLPIQLLALALWQQNMFLPQCVHNSSTALSLDSLRIAGLLSSLLQIQQLEHDIEAIYPLYLHMCQGMTDLTHSVPSNQDSKHSRPGHFDDMTQQNDDARLHMQQLHELPHTQQLRCLRNYLLAATAKDCSIMITMQVLPEDEPVQGRGSISIHGCQKAVTYKVAVVDLDVKAAFKIISHYQLDCQLQAVNRM